MTTPLPPGPTGGVMVQTVGLHRDPVGWLLSARERYGDVFTIRLATARPIVVVCDPALTDAGRAGEARRRRAVRAPAGAARRAARGRAGTAARARRGRDDVFRETLRLRPPALGMLRRLTEPMTAAGRTLPAGVTVVVPIPVVQRDGAYVPFGRGPRSCVGEARQDLRGDDPADAFRTLEAAARRPRARADGAARHDPRAALERPGGRQSQMTHRARFLDGARG
jgi:cytochrome P450